MSNLQNHIGPGDMQAQQQQQHAVEDVVGGEHWYNAWCFNRCTVNHTRIESHACDDPNDCEYCENAVAQFLVVCVFGNFGRFQKDIGTVMNHQHQRTDTMQITDPAQ